MTEESKRVAYCKEKNVHHLFELLATKVLQERPDNIFAFLRDQLSKVEEAESKSHSHDPSKILRDANEKNLMRITLAIFGLDNAGKTALLAAMGGEVDTNTTPTVGFSPLSFEDEKHEICIFDLGGGKNFRGIWSHYFHDCHAIIYAIDSSDASRFAESADALNEVMRSKYVKGKPILVYSNKKDVANSKPVSAINNEILKLSEILEPGTPFKIVSSCAVTLDPEVEAGVQWIIQTVDQNYDTLSARVKLDTADVQAEKKRKLAEQMARVEAQKRQQSEQ
jgi:Arf/Sar family protein